MTQGLNIFVALVTGLITGLYFERRASRATREQNEQLRSELHALRSSVYSVGGSEKQEQRQEPLLDNDALDSAVVKYVRDFHDPEGLVRRAALIARFTSEGYSRDSIDEALHRASNSGTLREEGKWVILP